MKYLIIYHNEEEHKNIIDRLMIFDSLHTKGEKEYISIDDILFYIVKDSEYCFNERCNRYSDIIISNESYNFFSKQQLDMIMAQYAPMWINLGLFKFVSLRERMLIDKIKRLEE